MKSVCYSRTLQPPPNSCGMMSAGHSHARDMFDLPSAVADAFRTDAHPIQQCKVKISHRSLFLERDVPPGFKAAVASARQQDGKIFVQVAVAVAQSAAVDDQRMIQQCAVAVTR